MSQDIENRLNEWVKEHYQWLAENISKNIAKGRMKEHSTDLLHHIILDLYKMNPAKMEGLLDNGKLKWYVLTGAGMQLRSSTSPFYKTHRKERMQARSGVLDEGMFDNKITVEGSDIDGEEDLLDCFERAMKQINWYQRTLLEKKIIEGKSYQEIYEHYNISKTHLIKDINAGVREIRSICKNAKNK